MTDCSWRLPDVDTICEINRSNPRECPMYGNDCPWCNYEEEPGEPKGHPGRRRMTEEQVDWAILKYQQGYKTKWIANALNVTPKTVERNIEHYTGFKNIKDVFKHRPPIALVYDASEVKEWERKLP